MERVDRKETRNFWFPTRRIAAAVEDNCPI
jgi:hypothetical protein